MVLNWKLLVKMKRKRGLGQELQELLTEEMAIGSTEQGNIKWREFISRFP